MGMNKTKKKDVADNKVKKKDSIVYKALFIKKELAVFNSVLYFAFGDYRSVVSSDKELVEYVRDFISNLEEIKALATTKNVELDMLVEGFTDDQRVEYFQLLNFCRKNGFLDFSLVVEGD